MCFSISYAKKAKELQDRFGAKFSKDEKYEPAYHVSAFNLPKTPVITNCDPKRIQMVTWGLIPFWAKGHEDAQSIQKKTFPDGVVTYQRLGDRLTLCYLNLFRKGD